MSVTAPPGAASRPKVRSGAGDPSHPTDRVAARGGARFAIALAVCSYVALGVLVLTHASTPREPDPYADRASIAALRQSHLTLTRSQYEALDLALAQRHDGAGIGIAQWRRTPNGHYASEKNSGYPFFTAARDSRHANVAKPSDDQRRPVQPWVPIVVAGMFGAVLVLMRLRRPKNVPRS